MHQLIRRAAAAIATVAFIISVPSVPRAQSVAPVDRKITYILPQWFEFLYSTNEQVKQQADILRARIGEGPRVKVGFTTYIVLNMTPVDPTDTAAVRAALAPQIAEMDRAVALARHAGIPICISVLSPNRDLTDAAQVAALNADRRTLQWHSDNSIAPGWMTLSRYSRKDVVLREAFVREFGRQLAARMLQYPETLVAASGDGEVELAYDKTVIGHPTVYAADGSDSLLADYSPFAIAEFRDWLRGTGLYASGQPFAGEAYSNSSRYAADASLATLNTDFGTNFQTWNLKHFDWSLSDSPTADPRAIPAGTYNASGFNATPNETPGGFDAPRVRQPSDPWWKLWDLFRQTMVHRHNIAWAKWITTSPDPASGATVPADRWFTDQIAADHVFANVAILPANPTGFNTPPTFRLDTSASPYWTADVSPYGSLGITAFNLYIGPVAGVDGEVYYRTLAPVAPLIAARNVRWGIFEWNPATPPNLSDPAIYELEMVLIEKYRPSVLSPFAWTEGIPGMRVLDTPFETALKNYVTRRHNVPLTLSKSTLNANTLTTGTARTPPQTVRVSGEPGETPSWNATSASAFIQIVKSADGRSFTVELRPEAYAAGVQSATITVTPTTAGYVASSLTVNVTATVPGATAQPVGSFDTPADNAVVSGEVGVTGWAVDDVGILGIDIYREPIAGEPSALVRLGSATLVPGARPDVLAAFPTQPLSEQAGWGYMLLSNFLPNQGNGTFTLHAVARDADGHSVTLGTRRIVCQNATAVLPFGTIDTPGQGETVSGTITNFGWALSPSGIATDGSTIGVYIDNVFVGRPSYNHVRADIAALFPGYPNTSNGNGAIGFFQIDTTRYANGVHTISWVVTDSAGRAQGIGSRYFTIANP